MSLDRWEEFLKLEEIAERSQLEPNVWKVIYCLSDSTEMLRADSDGALHIERITMSERQRDFCVKAFEQFKRCAFAYSGGNIRIESLRRDLEGPFRGEYSGTTFFWPEDFIDLGEGISIREYDSVIGHFYPELVRTPHASGTTDSERWCRGLGHSSVMLDPSSETGGQTSVMAQNTLREWLNQIASSQKDLGYYGMPDVSSLGSYARNPNCYYMRYIVTPQQWRTLSMRGKDLRAQNRPKSSDEGFIREWLVCGPFFAEERTILDTAFFDEESITPSEGEITKNKEWRLLLSENPEVPLRDFSPLSRRDAVVFAHAYVFSPHDIEARLWMGGPEPFSVRLNGKEGIRIWEGSAKDTVVRDVTLKAGWNRLLVKKLDQDSGDDWWFTARFTGPDNSPLASVKYSAVKPNDGIVEDGADGFIPVEIKHHSWDEVKNDVWGRLPVLSEEHLDEIVGGEGVKIQAGKDNDYLFINVSELRNVTSQMISAPDVKDSLLNNELNFPRETAALVSYTAKDGSPHDLLFLRIDMVEPFLDMILVPPGGKRLDPHNRILGYILRDRKPAIVIDTFLGQSRLNEFDILVSRNEDVSIGTRFSRDRIIRGEDIRLTVYVRNIGKNIIDIGTLELTGFPDGKTVKLGSIYNFVPGEKHLFAFDLPTEKLERGQLMLKAVMAYGIAGKTRTITKPVPLDVRDTVGVTAMPEHSALQTQREFDVLVELRNNSAKRERGTVRLELPRKWKSRPSSHGFDLKKTGDSKTVRFTVHMREHDPDGSYVIEAVAETKARKALRSTSELRLNAFSGTPLIAYSFDKGIERDFAITEGAYKVGISRDKPFAGLACLKIEDEGGSHYGHVWMFSKETLSPIGKTRDQVHYSYDTDDYPIIDFRLRSASTDSNLGIHVVLDDNKPGYGILINGKWDRELSLRPMIGRIDFVPDGKWRHIVIDLDSILDDYLGDVTHRVIGIKLGDTRELDFGRWTGTGKREHFIDEFSIRKR